MKTGINTLSINLSLLALPALFSGCGSSTPQEDPLAKYEAAYASWMEVACPYFTKLPQGAIIRREYTRFQDGDKTYPMFEYTVRANRPDAVFSMTYVIETDTNNQPVRISRHMYGINFVLLSSRTTGKGPYGEIENQYRGIDLPSRELTNFVERLLAGDDFSDLVNKTKSNNRIIQSTVVEYDNLRNLQ